MTPIDPVRGIRPPRREYLTGADVLIHPGLSVPGESTMEIGFTGTRQGMTEAQGRNVARVLATYGGAWRVHHGDCIGADEEFHFIVEDHFPGLVIHVHPPDDSSRRAFTHGDVYDDPLPYLARNRVIVACSTLLIACPAQATARHRGSGTWATVREAERAGVPYLLLTPDGGVSHS